MENETQGRTDRQGHTMKATEVALQKNGDSWDNPLIIFHSESFFPDGSAYKPAGIEPDRITAMEAVQRGYWTPEQAMQAKELFTILYEKVGANGIH